MIFPYAIAWTDHLCAHVLQFDHNRVQAMQIHAHPHAVVRDGSSLRSDPEFLGNVCDALRGIGEVLVVGSHTAVADFRQYVAKHRLQLSAHIVGFDVLAQQSESQLLTYGRDYFVHLDISPALQFERNLADAGRTGG